MITITEKLYQWDTGREVEIRADRCDKVQFAPQGSSVAVSVTPEPFQVGEWIAPIPDEVLQSGKPITVFLVDILANNKEVTKEARVFPITPRPRPKDYLPSAAAEAIGELKKITDEAKAAADMALAAANIMFVGLYTEDDDYVSASSQEIYAHVEKGGTVYLRWYQGNTEHYFSLVESLPTKATFMGYYEDSREKAIRIVYVEGNAYNIEYITYSAFLNEAQVLSLIANNSLKDSDVIDLLESGDIQTINMGGNAIVNAGGVYSKHIGIEDESGSYGAVIEPGAYDSGYAVLDFYGVNGDERTILRNLAPGKHYYDSATVGQVNEKVNEIVDAIGDALDEIHAYAERLIGGA